MDDKSLYLFVEGNAFRIIHGYELKHFRFGKNSTAKNNSLGSKAVYFDLVIWLFSVCTTPYSVPGFGPDPN